MGYPGYAKAKGFNALAALAGLDGSATAIISRATGRDGFIEAATEVATHNRIGDRRTLIVNNDNNSPAFFLASALTDGRYDNATHV